MRIFISHAIKDAELIENVKKTLEPHKIELLIAEHYVDTQNTITQKIESMIKGCDFALFLLTEHGFNSFFVHQEVGYALSQRKPMIQLVQIGLENKISGFLYGRDYISYNLDNPDLALNNMKKILLEYWRKQEQKRIRVQQTLMYQIQQENLEQNRLQQLQKAKEAKEAKIGLGILAGLLVLAIATSD